MVNLEITGFVQKQNKILTVSECAIQIEPGSNLGWPQARQKPSALPEKLKQKTSAEDNLIYQ